MGDELGRAGGSGRCQQDRWRVFVGLEWHGPGTDTADEQDPPGQSASVGATRASYEALLLCEDLRLDGLDVGIKLLLAEIESGLQALEDLAQFGGLEPLVRRARDRSNAKTRVQRNRHFRPVRHVEHNPVSRPNTMGQECA